MAPGRPPKLRHKQPLKGQRQAAAKKVVVSIARSQLTQEQADAIRTSDTLRHRDLVVDVISE